MTRPAFTAQQQLHCESAVFISDLHLANDTPQLLAHLRRFLLSLNPATSQWLVVLGDLFEGYCGDDDTTDINQTVAHCFADLHTRGIQVAIVVGNRDFLIADGFAKCANAILLHDPCVLNNDVLLSHGDRWCTLDTAYQAWRTQCRSPAWQAAFLAQPLVQRQQQVQQYRAMSIQVQQQSNNGIDDVVQDLMLAEVQRYGCSAVLHGHTHRPEQIQLNITSDKTITAATASAASPKTITKIVLGDWRIENGVPTMHYAQLEQGKIYFKQF